MIKLSKKQERSLWWKISYLFIAFNKWFNVPKSIILKKKVGESELYSLYREEINTPIYIVRSSASLEDWVNFSFAWIFDSIEWFYSKNSLYTDYCDVLSSFNNTWVKIYEDEKKINISNMKVNILVQEYISWEYSWVYFSRFKNWKLIEFVKWWNALLVNWRVSPSSIFLWSSDKVCLKKQDKYLDKELNIVNYWKLNKLFIKKYYNLVKYELEKLEKLYNFPIDVEWTVRDSKLYILQVRPIIV